MLLAVDIGNSSISLGLFDENGKLGCKSKLSADVARSAEEYAVLLAGILQLHGFTPACVTECMIASVVPLLTGPISEAIRLLFGVQGMEVGPGIRTGLDIKIDSQAQLGADIVANAAAALALCKEPILIVDIGTATTFTVIDRARILQGVIIAPGLRMSMNALSDGASELPDASIALPKRLIGKNTRESMNSGVLYGHAFMIDGFIDRLQTEGQTVLLTGGLAELVRPLLHSKTQFCPDLTLEGLQILYRKNKK